LDKLKVVLENNNTKINSKNIVCISGKAFNYILEKYLEEQKLNNELKKKDVIYSGKSDNIIQNPYGDLLSILENHCKIFYRMLPHDKVNLVNFYKLNKDNITAMCGDGSNDCGALFSADVGVAIRKNEGASISSHFFYDEKSIACMDIILKNGRACLENTLIVFKFFIAYAINQTILTVYLYSQNDDMTNSQYFYLDCFTALLYCLLACKLSANYTQDSKYDTKPIIGFEFLFSTFAQILWANLKIVII